MGQAKGSASTVLFDWESSFKTQKASASRYPKSIGFANFDVNKSVPLNQSSIIRGNRNPAAPYEGNTSVEGTITVALDYKGIGLFLKALVGEPSSSSSSGADIKAGSPEIDIVDGVATLTVVQTAWTVGDIIETTTYATGTLYIYSITSTTVCTVRDAVGKDNIADIACETVDSIKTPTFTHTFKIDATADLDSFVCELANADIDIPLYRLYQGLKANSCSINFNASGDELLATINVMGSNMTQSDDVLTGAGTVAIVCGVATFSVSQVDALVGDFVVTADGSHYFLVAGSDTSWDMGTVRAVKDEDLNVSSNTPTALIRNGRYDGGATDTPYVLPTNRFEMKDASMKFGGSTSSVFNAFTLELGNAIDPDSYTIGGGGIRRYLPEGIAGVGGNFDALFEDVTITDVADAGSETSLQVDIEFSATRKITFDFAEVRVQESSASVSGPQGLRLNLDWQGYYSDHADASAVKVTLINDSPLYTV